MKRLTMPTKRLLLALFLFATCAEARQTVGVYKWWAAFRDDAPSRCYAISTAQRASAPAPGAAFATVANWPLRRLANQIHVRLSRSIRPGSTILLTIDARVFQLVGRGADAWAPVGPAGREIVAAMRTGLTMRVAARDERGNAFTDSYVLSGAATAIDAASLACRRR